MRIVLPQAVELSWQPQAKMEGGHKREMEVASGQHNNMLVLGFCIWYLKQLIMKFKAIRE